VSEPVDCQFYESEDDPHPRTSTLQVHLGKCSCCDYRVVYFSLAGADGDYHGFGLAPEAARVLALGILEAAGDAGGLQ
jgi:hypothetical protein